ncbi:TY-Chap2 family putative peptide chaperone [Microbacterium sp. NPDC055903]
MIIVIHRARVVPYGSLEPVGAWSIDGMDALPYYPASFADYEPRGAAALFGGPPSAPLEEWARHKVETSPNWQKFAVADVLFDAVPDLAEAYSSTRKAHDAKSALQSAVRAPAGGATVRPVASGQDVGRWVILQSWRLAARVVRQHPELLAYEMHPGGGSYDVLCIAHPQQLSPNASSTAPRAMLNRAGSIQIHDGSGFHTEWPMPGDGVSIAALAEDVQRAAGWNPPARTPEATPRSLAYRFLAAALELTFFDKTRWDARSAFYDSSGDASSRTGVLEGFASVGAEAQSVPRLGIYGEPDSHFWSLMRGGEAVLIVSIEGRVHRKGKPTVDLMLAYAQSDRSIRRTAARLLADWL